MYTLILCNTFYNIFSLTFVSIGINCLVINFHVFCMIVCMIEDLKRKHEFNTLILILRLHLIMHF